MGCPVNKVVKTGAGAALMKDEKLAVKIVKAVIKASNKPITVKMRLGWDKNNINYLSLAKKLEKAGVCAITLHARTRTQMYNGKANWDAIKKLKKENNLEKIINIIHCQNLDEAVNEARKNSKNGEPKVIPVECVVKS